jgi:AcrR family transcriptional regulator
MSRARPLQRDAILDATEQVLRRHGPDKATVVDVSRALGVSHASIYRQFPTKQALRGAVTARWLERVIEPLQEIVSAPGPALERARVWFETLNSTKRRLAVDDPDLFATYVRLLDDSPEMIDVHVSALIDQLTTIIRTGVAEGSIAAPDPPRTARAVFYAMSRFHHPRNADYWQHPELEEHFADVWHLALDGIRPRSGRSAVAR